MFANEVNWKEVAAEVWHGLRHLTPRKAWAWLTYDNGLRLFILLVVVPLILLADHYHWFR